MEQMTKSILEMSRKAAIHLFDREIENVVKNILDPDAIANAKRKITLTAVLVPDEERQNIGVKFFARSTLAPKSPVITNLFVMNPSTEDGPQIVEMTPQVPGQLDIFGNVQDASSVLRIGANSEEEDENEESENEEDKNEDEDEDENENGDMENEDDDMDDDLSEADIEIMKEAEYIERSDLEDMRVIKELEDIELEDIELAEPESVEELPVENTDKKSPRRKRK